MNQNNTLHIAQNIIQSVEKKVEVQQIPDGLDKIEISQIINQAEIEISQLKEEIIRLKTITEVQTKTINQLKLQLQKMTDQHNSKLQIVQFESKKINIAEENPFQQSFIIFQNKRPDQLQISNSILQVIESQQKQCLGPENIIDSQFNNLIKELEKQMRSRKKLERIILLQKVSQINNKFKQKAKEFKIHEKKILEQKLELQKELKLQKKNSIQNLYKLSMNYCTVSEQKKKLEMINQIYMQEFHVIQTEVKNIQIKQQQKKNKIHLLIQENQNLLEKLNEYKNTTSKLNLQVNKLEQQLARKHHRKQRKCNNDAFLQITENKKFDQKNIKNQQANDDKQIIKQLYNQLETNQQTFKTIFNQFNICSMNIRNSIEKYKKSDQFEDNNSFNIYQIELLCEINKFESILSKMFY